MGRRKMACRLSNLVYSNPGLNRKALCLGNNIRTVRCILGKIEMIRVCKKIKK